MTVKQAPQPEPWGVLYKYPNPDGSRKRCKNCTMWASQANRCLIHSGDVEVLDRFICGYHMFGSPGAKWTPRPGMLPVDPSLSGLRIAGSGLSCDTCIYFEEGRNEKGSCWAVARPSDKEVPAPVDDLGWCARHKAL